jgi:hypothetical protein
MGCCPGWTCGSAKSDAAVRVAKLLQQGAHLRRINGLLAAADRATLADGAFGAALLLGRLGDPTG